MAVCRLISFFVVTHKRMRVLRFLRFFGILKKQRKSVKVLTFQKLFPVSRQKTEDIVIFKGVRSSLQSHLLWVNVYSVHHRAYSLAHLQWSIRWRLRLCMYKIIYLSNKNLAETSSGQTTVPQSMLLVRTLFISSVEKYSLSCIKIYILSGSL